MSLQRQTRKRRSCSFMIQLLPRAQRGNGSMTRKQKCSFRRKQKWPHVPGQCPDSCDIVQQLSQSITQSILESIKSVTKSGLCLARRQQPQVGVQSSFMPVYVFNSTVAGELMLKASVQLVLSAMPSSRRTN